MTMATKEKLSVFKNIHKRLRDQISNFCIELTWNWIIFINVSLMNRYCSYNDSEWISHFNWRRDFHGQSVSFHHFRQFKALSHADSILIIKYLIWFSFLRSATCAILDHFQKLKVLGILGLYSPSLSLSYYSLETCMIDLQCTGISFFRKSLCVVSFY